MASEIPCGVESNPTTSSTEPREPTPSQDVNASKASTAAAVRHAIAGYFALVPPSCRYFSRCEVWRVLANLRYGQRTIKC